MRNYTIAFNASVSTVIAFWKLIYVAMNRSIRVLRFPMPISCVCAVSGRLANRHCHVVSHASALRLQPMDKADKIIFRVA